MDEQTMKEMWGALALRGIVYTLFGVAAVFWPGLTLRTLVYLFSALVLASGLIGLVSSLVNLSKAGTFFSRFLGALLGVLEIGVGVYLLRHPQVTFATFILIIGFTLIFRGVIECVAGLFESNTVTYKTIMVLTGLLATLAGIIVLFQPVASGVAFVWILGLYALITGPLMIALALDAKHSVAK